MFQILKVKNTSLLLVVVVLLGICLLSLPTLVSAQYNSAGLPCCSGNGCLVCDYPSTNTDNSNANNLYYNSSGLPCCTGLGCLACNYRPSVNVEDIKATLNAIQSRVEQLNSYNQLHNTNLNGFKSVPLSVPITPPMPVVTSDGSSDQSAKVSEIRNLLEEILKRIQQLQTN